jgi:hypothetical protein
MKQHRRMRPTFLALAAAVVVALPLSATASAGGPRIVNGLSSHDFPTTGALMYPGLPTNIHSGNADSWCSGTLIGCETFLTAAHCVEDSSNPSHYWVFLQHAGIRAVTSVVSHSSYSFPEADVAVLKLGAPVEGIDPTEINTTMSPSFGTAGTIAGFGQTSGSAGDYGIKRYGNVETSNCSGAVPAGLGNTELVCWQFTNPIGSPGDDSNTCNGDSGGPLFVDFGGGEVVAGITSGGSNGSCLPTDKSYDANVYTYRSFIQTQLGADSTSTCGSLGAVGDPTVTVIDNDGNLSAGNPNDTITINVTGTPQEMRVTLKGEDNGSLEVDFYVKQGTGAGPGSFDCKADAGSNVGACIFATPAAGAWEVFVARTSGSGEYQVTTTLFGTDPPVCGNNIQESGEDCDGTDDNACSGLCQVDCLCPAPVCGNNVRESGEQCDGTDDTSCPGQCSGSCACPAICNDGALFIKRGRSDEKRFVWKGEINNFGGQFDGLDPRNQFELLVSQGGDSVSVSIPALDPGWERSNPAKGRYLWKGDIGGITRVKLIDRTATKGIWKWHVKGKAVPGADLLNVINFFADVEMTADGVCGSGVY